MAQINLNTRIKVKYDTLENWNSNNPILLAGEIAIATVPGGSSAHNIEAPQLLMKVGDGTSNFSALKFVSAQAADVYAWAKAANKPSYTATEVGAATAADISSAIGALGKEDAAVEGQYVSAVSQENGVITVTRAQLPTAPEYTLATGATDGTVKLLKNGVQVGSDIPVMGWSDVVKSADIANFAVKGEITNADIAEGAAIAVSKISGLGALATKDSLTKAEVGLGNVENKTMDSAPTADSTNYVTSGGVKEYVDSAVSAVATGAFVVPEDGQLPESGETGKIYLIPHEHDEGDSYDEYIWVDGAWEKIGNTDIDLSGYVPTSRKINGQALTGDVTLDAADVGAATAEDITSAIGALVDTLTGTPGAGKTLTAFDQVDGKVSATFSNIAITQEQVEGLTGALAGKEATGTAQGLIEALDVSDSAVANQYVTAVSETDGKIAVTRKQIAYSELSGAPTFTGSDGVKVTSQGGTVTIGLNKDEDVFIFNCGTSTENI